MSGSLVQTPYRHKMLNLINLRLLLLYRFFGPGLHRRLCAVEVRGFLFAVMDRSGSAAVVVIILSTLFLWVGLFSGTVAVLPCQSVMLLISKVSDLELPYNVIQRYAARSYRELILHPIMIYLFIVEILHCRDVLSHGIFTSFLLGTNFEH